MAEKVEIDIPGIGKIQAENAATEATLQEILKVLQDSKKTQDKLEKNSGKTTKGAAGGPATGPDFSNVDKQSAKTAKAMTAAEKAAYAQAVGQQAAAKIANGAGLAILGFSKGVVGAANVIGTLGNAAGNAALSMTSLIEDMANVGNSVTKAAGTLRNIPVVGGVLAGVFGAVAGAAENVVKSYQDSASVGATFGGSVQAMSAAASGAGLTLDTFGKLIKDNGESLMMLGGTTEEGAKRFGQLGKEIRNSQVGSELQRLGYSTEEINGSMAKYIGILGKTGAIQGMSTSQIAQASGAYMKELDALARITGETRAEKEKEQQALMSDAKVRAAMAGLDADSQRQMMTYITSFPKEQQAAIADMIATGNMTTEESIKLQSLLPNAAAQAMEFGRTLKAGGKVNNDAINSAKNNAILEARESVKRNQARGLYDKEAGAAYVGAANLAAQEVNGFSKAIGEQGKAAEKANLAENLEKSKQKLAEFSNGFQMALANSGLLDSMLEVFGVLANFVQTIVVPAFQAMIPIITGYIVPALQILGHWIGDSVVPILQKLGNIVGSVLSPIFEGVGSVLEDVLEPALYTFSDFIEDNLVPILAATGAAFLAFNAAKMISTALTIADNVATGVKTAATIAATLGVAGLAAAAWATVAPLLALAAPVLAAVAAFAAAWVLVKKFGVDLTVVGDGFKYFGSLLKTIGSYFMLMVNKILNLLPGVDRKKEIEEIEKDIKDQEKDRSELADKMQTRMADNLKKQEEEQKKTDAQRDKRDEARGQRKHEREMKAIGDKEQREKDAEDKKSEAEAGAEKVDISDPIAMLKSFASQQKSAYSQEAKALDDKEKARSEMKMASDAYNKAMEQAGKARTQEEKDLAEKSVKEAEGRMKKAQEAQNKADEVVEKAAARMKAAKEGKDTGPEKPTATGKPAGAQAAPSFSGNKIEGLGRVAAQFESGGKAGTVSSGAGDFGGKSYGAFQLSSKTGDLDKFLKSSGYADQFKGLKTGSKEFDEKWKQLGETKEFAEAQQKHAVSTHYDPQMAKLKKSGIDLSGKGAGVQEAIMSTANQYGANTDVIEKALKGKDTAKMDDKAIINAIQDYKASTVKERFKSSSGAVQEGVAKRIEQERSALLGVQGGPIKPEDSLKKGEEIVKTKTPGGTAIAQASPQNVPGTMPDTALSGLVKDGINPTTIAFQNLNKQLQPIVGMMSGVQVKTPLGANVKDAENARTNFAAIDPRRTDSAAAEEKAKTEAITAKAKASKSSSTTTAKTEVQETPESLLAQLNTKMDQLIAISKNTHDLNDKQLSVQKGLSNDLFA